MGLFTRKPKAQPETDLHSDETVAVLETVKPDTEIVQPCAHCGAVGATHRFLNGDLYLKRLPYNFLCDVCFTLREAARNRHNIANHDTVLEQPAIPARPRRRARVEEQMRQPSRPLTDRMHDLGLEA